MIYSTALDVLFDPRYDPKNKRRRRYEVTLRSTSGKYLRGIVLRFGTSGTASLQFPEDLGLNENSKSCVKRLVDNEIRTIIRKLDTAGIEDMYLLGDRVSEASWQAFLKQVGLD